MKLTLNNGSSRNRLLACLLASSMLIAPGLPGSPLGSISFANAEPVTVNAAEVPGFADVVDAVSPAVVSVRVEQEVNPASQEGRFGRQFDDEDGGRFFGMPPFFRNNPFFDQDQGRGERRGQGGERRRDRQHQRFGMSQGSGFFVSEDGYVVTNHHVVENGSKFTVVMNDGSELDATLVGADARSDLAVLKVKSDTKFTYVTFEDESVRIGDWVVAVGNPFGLGGTVTAGIVSARNREISTNRYDDFIQIDAAVNRGNSGGPAFNLQGRVIGINTAIFSPSGGNVGIAFAIPASTAREVVDELISNGQVVRGWLGVQIQPVTRDIAQSLGMDSAGGAIVTSPQDGSPAAKAGIRSGDVITAVDGDAIKGPRELARKIGGYHPEQKVSVTLWRNGESRDVEVTLGRLDTQEIVASQDTDTPQGKMSALGLILEQGGDSGVVVAEVDPAGKAAAVGIEPGDVITSVNGEEVENPVAVDKIVGDASKAGRKAVLFQVTRDGDSRFVAIPLKRG
ncbi:MAG: Do family serine endopeptidase [Rhizobiaceae bacterium]